MKKMTYYEVKFSVMSDKSEEEVMKALEDVLMELICVKDPVSSTGAVLLEKKSCPNGEYEDE